MNKKLFFSLTLLFSVGVISAMQEPDLTLSSVFNEHTQRLEALLKNAQAERTDEDCVKYHTQEDRRELIIDVCTKIEWLAKSCREFHENKFEEPKTKSFTTSTLSSIRELLKKIRETDK